MDNKITVIWAAHHDDAPAGFPAQSVPESEIELIRVRERDDFHPHRASMAAIAKAHGKYTILLDQGDQFPHDFLERLCAALDATEDVSRGSGATLCGTEAMTGKAEAGSQRTEAVSHTKGPVSRRTEAALAVPEQVYRHGALTERLFPFPAGKDVLIDSEKTPYLFPAELPGLLLRTAAVQALLPSILGIPDDDCSVRTPNGDSPDDGSIRTPDGDSPDDGSIRTPAGDSSDDGSVRTPDEEFPDDGASVEPEKALLLALLDRAPVFPYVGTCTLHCEIARETDYMYDLRSYSRDWYYAPLENFLLPLLQEKDAAQPSDTDTQSSDSAASTPSLLRSQYLALFMIYCRINANLNNRQKHVIEHDEAFSAYAGVLSDVLQYVSEEAILSTPLFSTDTLLPQKLLMLRLKLRDFSYYPELICRADALELQCGGRRFAAQKSVNVQLVLIDYKNGCLEIDGALPDLYDRNALSVCAALGQERYPLTYNQRYSLIKCFGATFAKLNTFHVSVPVPSADKEQLLQFFLCAGGREYRAELSFPYYTSRFSKEFSHAYWRFGSFFSCWKKDGIHITRARKPVTLYHELRLWVQLWRVRGGKYRSSLPLKVLNFLLRPYFSRQHIWLFFDKIYKGGDSSEYLYKYCAQQRDGIRKYYLLDPKVPDYQRLRREGYRPLVRGSLKHRLIFLNATLVVASNSTVFPFNDYNFEQSFPIRGDVRFDVACVQHGMSIQKIALAQQRLRDNTKLYFCASKYEIQNLMHPIYDYAGYDILKLTGVPRYDGLHDRKQKILLFSPTWRMNSAMPVAKSEGVARDYNPNFKQTSYFRVYNSLMNDPRLLDAAQKYGYRIQYVLHPIVSPQYDDFTKNDLVEIIPSTGEMSYEKLFCEAALMVTDFSGVQFDFAYMRKPVVYLHHNEIPQHYENGTFFYDTMGFGEICRTNEELIDVLCSYMKTGCEMPEQYRRRADDFFAFADDRNCERIYPLMLEHERARRESAR